MGGKLTDLFVQAQYANLHPPKYYRDVARMRGREISKRTARRLARAAKVRIPDFGKAFEQVIGGIADILDRIVTKLKEKRE